MSKKGIMMDIFMKYGMIVIAVLIIVSLFVFFGLLDPRKFSSEYCITSQAIPCEEHNMKADAITLILKNKTGSDISTLEIQMQGTYCEDYEYEDVIDSGDSAKMMIKCSLPKGKHKQEFKIVFMNDNGVRKTFDGMIKGVV